jgi:hypothetical protein
MTRGPLAVFAANVLVGLFGCDPIVARQIADQSSHQHRISDVLMEMATTMQVTSIYSLYFRPEMDVAQYAKIHEALCLTVRDQASRGAYTVGRKYRAFCRRRGITQFHCCADD